MSLPVITPDAAAQPGALHLGRSWAGTALEDACPDAAPTVEAPVEMQVVQ